jgi:hypothetical protein
MATHSLVGQIRTVWVELPMGTTRIAPQTNR